MTRFYNFWLVRATIHLMGPTLNQKCIALKRLLYVYNRNYIYLCFCFQHVSLLCSKAYNIQHLPTFYDLVVRRAIAHIRPFACKYIPSKKKQKNHNDSLDTASRIFNDMQIQYKCQVHIPHVLTRDLERTRSQLTQNKNYICVRQQTHKN